MLYVHHNFGGPHGSDWNKSINLKILPRPINTNGLSDFQKSEWPISRTAKKPNQSLPQHKNRTNKIYFQNTRTPDSDWSWTNHVGSKSGTITIMKSLWKLTLALWVQDNFAGLVTALKHLKSYNTFYPTPTHQDHRSPVKVDINKTYLYKGKTRYSKWIWTQSRLQINLFKTATTKGHQIFQSITKLKYIKRKWKGHDQHFVFCLTFSFSWKWVQD